MNVVIQGTRNPNNPIDANCLKRIEAETVMIDTGAKISFYVYDNNNLLGRVIGYVAPDKAGILLTRCYIGESEKEAIFKSVLETIFNYNSMGQRILQISIFGEEFGKIDHDNLIHIGCVNIGLGATHYRLLNPQYLEIVRQYAASDENIQDLIKQYNNYQQKKLNQQTKLLNLIQIHNNAIADPTVQGDKKKISQSEVIWCEEAIEALGDTTPYALEEDDTLKDQTPAHRQK